MQYIIYAIFIFYITYLLHFKKIMTQFYEQEKPLQA